MLLDRHIFGDYQILVAATPSSSGGFTAAVAIKKLGAPTGDDIFADFMLADGFLFADPDAALKYALEVGYRYLKRLEPE